MTTIIYKKKKKVIHVKDQVKKVYSSLMTLIFTPQTHAIFRSRYQDKESDRNEETPTLPLISPWYSSTGIYSTVVVVSTVMCFIIFHLLFVYVFRYYLFPIFALFCFLFYYVILRKCFFFLSSFSGGAESRFL